MNTLPYLLPQPSRLTLLGGPCPHSILSSDPVVVHDPSLPPEAYRLELLPTSVRISSSSTSSSVFPSGTGKLRVHTPRRRYMSTAE